MRAAVYRSSLVALILLLAGCSESSDPTAGPVYADKPENSTDQTTYSFAIHPLFNPVELQQAYQPVMDYLSANIEGAEFNVEGSIHYQAYEEKIRSSAPDFLLPNPWQTLVAMEFGYDVIAEAGNSEDFRGIFIVRKDSDIREVADLKGGVVSYPSQTALAAAIMPQTYLYEQGLDINVDITNEYVGSQQASILNAYLRQSDVAATWPPPWRLFQLTDPDKAKEMQVIWETESLINNSVMVHQRVDSQVATQVQNLLAELASSSEGRKILEASQTDAFHRADNQAYDKVREYVAEFERNVRLVEEGL